MKHPIAIVGALAALLVVAIPVPGSAKPKDRGMNQGEDQAIYCKREHPGDESACCDRGRTRNIKRSCCRAGGDWSDDAAFVCVGGVPNEIWKTKGFETIEECGTAAETHHVSCTAGIGG